MRENGFKSYYDIEKSYKDNWHFDFLHSHTRQQMFKVLEQNWKGYFASIKDLVTNPSKYKGCPRSPKFKNTKEINKLRKYRNNYINDYLNKVSKKNRNRLCRRGKGFFMEVLYKRKFLRIKNLIFRGKFSEYKGSKY